MGHGGAFPPLSLLPPSWDRTFDDPGAERKCQPGSSTRPWAVHPTEGSMPQSSFLQNGQDYGEARVRGQDVNLNLR